jgi:hypothetical protein
VLVSHRLILSRLFGSLFHQSLADLVRVADRFFNSETLLAAFAIFKRPFGSANIAMPFDNRLRHHFNNSLRRLLLSSVDLPKVFYPGQIPLGPSRDLFGVPEQDRNPIDAKLCQVLALRASVHARRLDAIGAYRASFRHLKPRLSHTMRVTCTLGKNQNNQAHKNKKYDCPFHFSLR